MATIANIVQTKIVEVYQLPSWEPRLPLRQLWVAYQFWDWVENTIELHDDSFKSGGRTLFEHMEQIFCDFRCSKRIGAGDIRRMVPNVDGIRKMHPVGLRIYGWAPEKDSFVAVTGTLESVTKRDKMTNDNKMKCVLDFIKSNNLKHTVTQGDNSVVYPPHD